MLITASCVALIAVSIAWVLTARAVVRWEVLSQWDFDPEWHFNATDLWRYPPPARHA